MTLSDDAHSVIKGEVVFFSSVTLYCCANRLGFFALSALSVSLLVVPSFLLSSSGGPLGYTPTTGLAPLCDWRPFTPKERRGVASLSLFGDFADGRSFDYSEDYKRTHTAITHRCARPRLIGSCLPGKSILHCSTGILVDLPAIPILL